MATKKKTTDPKPTPNERPTRPVNPPPPAVIALGPPEPEVKTQPVKLEPVVTAPGYAVYAIPIVESKPHADALRELLAATPLDLSGCVSMTPVKYGRYLKARHIAEAVLGS